MENLGLVVLGALIGVAGTIGAWHLGRKYRRKEFNQSLCVEFRELRYKMACDGFLLRQKTCTLTREFLDWQNPIIDEYQDRDLNLDNLSDEELKMVCEATRKSELEKDGGKERSELLKKIEMPLLEADVKALSLFSAGYQKMVLDIKSRVSWFNDGVEDLELNHKKIFDTTLSPENAKVVRQNLHEGYLRTVKLSFDMGKRIGVFLSKYRS